MSAVAGIAAHQGFEVNGSDSDTIYAPAKTVLDTYSIKYNIGYDLRHIEEAHPDLVVVGGGETHENSQVKFAIEKQYLITSFPELLWSLTKDKYRIVVAGTHGKTTTTALIALLLRHCGYNPGYFIGGLVQDFRSNFKWSESRFFVMEGDEYYSSFFDHEPKFLHYRPNLLVLNNIEMDHFDYFENREQLLSAFQRLVASLPGSGVLIANADDPNVVEVVKSFAQKVVWFSSEKIELEWFARFLDYKDEQMHFEVFHNGESWGKFRFGKPGEHYMKDCLAALATLNVPQLQEILNLNDSHKNNSSKKQYCHLGADFVPPLKNFQGATRRFEKIADVKGVRIYDDYAHHPTAVMKTLEATKKMYPERRLWAVYEPHTYSRTKETLSQLSSAFYACDVVIIPEIYAAREKHLAGLINGAKVVMELKKKHKNVHFIPEQKDVLSFLVKNVKKGDVVVVMAVGSFNSLAQELAQALKEKK